MQTAFDYFEQNGKYYGYPTCCIKAFIEPFYKEGRILNASERSKLQQETTKYGFIPCRYHAQEISEGKLSIEQLILPSRTCPRPFGRSIGKIEIPQTASVNQTMQAVQAHGFSWEKDLLRNIYGATEEELRTIGYTNHWDLPANFNRLNPVNLSIKVTGTPNAVCMGDCLRIFDAATSGTPFHLTVVTYIQNDETNMKKVSGIIELDLTNSGEILFGSLTREQIQQLDALVKQVPQRRSPTEEEHTAIYTLRNLLQFLSGAIHMDVKCNSQQSRLQCSFNTFQRFLQNHPERIVAQSQSAAFRGGAITEELPSRRRVFRPRN